MPNICHYGGGGYCSEPYLDHQYCCGDQLCWNEATGKYTRKWGCTVERVLHLPPRLSGFKKDMCSGNCGQPCCGEKGTAKMNGLRPPIVSVIYDPRTGQYCGFDKKGHLVECWHPSSSRNMNTQSAKMGGFDFGDLFGNGGFSFGSNFGVPLEGVPVYGSPQNPIWTDGSGVPVGTTTGGSQPTQQPTQGSAGGNSSGGGLSELDKLFALVLGTAPNIINSIRSSNGVLTNANGQVIATNATNQTAAGTLAQVGANSGAAAGSLTQGIFTFISQNPLLTLAVIGGGVLLLMPSPRSRNGILKLVPNPKRRTRRRRR